MQVADTLSQPTSRASTFEVLFSEAASLTLNIDCLGLIFADIGRGEGTILKEAMKDWVMSSLTPDPNVQLELSQHLVYGISMFKALRVELYLKALLVTESTEFPKTHDLLDLYTLLRFKTKQQLDVYLRGEQDWRQQPSPPVIRIPKLRAIMEKHRDDFVAVRYGEPLERRNARLRDGMMNLDSATSALQKACLDTPEGRPWLENVERGLHRKL